MVKVESRQTLRLLAARFMKLNRRRNAIAVLAVMLTSLLFTSLFMGCASLILSRRAAEVKQMMDSSHASLQDTSLEEAAGIVDAIENDENIARYGTGVFLGSAVDERFGFSAEVRSADRNLAESFNCVPAAGSLPEEADEIAVSTIILDALDIPRQLGAQISLTWEADPKTGRTRTDTFRLSGFWEGDKAVMAQIAWVSAEYADEHAYPVTKKELEKGIVNGGRDYCVWFTKKACWQNLWNLGALTDKLSEAAGYAGAGSGFTANPAYSLTEEDSFSFFSAAVMVLFIMLAGYLIIFNVFNISIRKDIRIYGLLKNAGTTGTQLKKCVRMQAWRLSAAGIPPGLALGWLAGLWMAPSLAADAEISAQAADTSTAVTSAHPAVFVLAGLFTLLTVYLSSLQACRIVRKVSPVDALRLAENSRSRKKTGKSTSASWQGMAAGNTARNWKQGIIVTASIALLMFVVNCIVMLVQGYDFDSYKDIFLASDFQLDQIEENSLRHSNFNGISPQVKETLEQCPYSRQTGYVYYSSEKYELDPELSEMLHDSAEVLQDTWADSETEIWNRTVKENKITVHLMGINEAVFDKLEWKGRPCSWEEFQSGDYVLADFDGYQAETASYYQKGESFQMKYQNGNSKEYEVLGSAWLPYALDYPFWDFMYLVVIVPEEEFIAQMGSSSAMYAAVDAEPGAERQVKQYIEETLLSEHDMLNVFSVVDMQESFQRYISKYYTIGAFLIVILGFIGIMNFFNTTSASVLSRRRELALLEAVGMTKPQITKMLAAEGCIYLGGAFAAAVAMVLFCSEKLLASTLGNTFFFHMHLTVLPCVALVPFLALTACGIPGFAFKKMCRESVVERIRSE